MNKDLLSNLMYVKYWYRKFPNLRANLLLPHGFGLHSKEKQIKYLQEPFAEFLRREHINSDIEILQENFSRARVVFQARALSGEKIVVKWANVDAPGCFNFIGSLSMERFMHKTIAPQLSNFIPEEVESGDDFLFVRHIDGESISTLMGYDRENELDDAFIKILGNLKLLYILTKGEAISAIRFNELVMRDYSYTIQTSSCDWRDILAAVICAPKDAHSMYNNISEKIFQIFQMRHSSWPGCMTLRDLDERNIVIERSTKNIFAVDMEDACHGNMLFDLAFLSTRMTLAAKPFKLFEKLVFSVEETICEIDEIESDASVSMFRGLYALQLICVLMNPRLWPSIESNHPLCRNSSLSEKMNWVSEGWQVVRALSSKLNLDDFVRQNVIKK